MSDHNQAKNGDVPDTEACENPGSPDGLYEPLEPRIATGTAPVLVEIICERVHCVLYDFAISTVDMILEEFGDQVDVQTVIRQGDKKDAVHFLELCRRAGKMLPVPTILINGQVMFTTVPHPTELGKAIRDVLEQKN